MPATLEKRDKMEVVTKLYEVTYQRPSTPRHQATILETSPDIPLRSPKICEHGSGSRETLPQFAWPLGFPSRQFGPLMCLVHHQPSHPEPLTLSISARRPRRMLVLESFLRSEQNRQIPAKHPNQASQCTPKQALSIPIRSRLPNPSTRSSPIPSNQTPPRQRRSPS